MRDYCKKLWRQEEGATALEYGLICALVVVVMVVSLMLLATQTINMYHFILTTCQNAIG